jgi:hypothetical protein
VFLPLPLESKEISRVQVVIRATGDPSTLVQTVRRELQHASPGNVVVNAFTFDQIMQVAAQEILVGTSPLFPLIAVGILLTTAGIYGTLAFAITRRSREFAVRVAIGASQRDIVGLRDAHGQTRRDRFHARDRRCVRAGASRPRKRGRRQRLRSGGGGVSRSGAYRVDRRRVRVVDPLAPGPADRSGVCLAHDLTGS